MRNYSYLELSRSSGILKFTNLLHETEKTIKKNTRIGIIFLGFKNRFFKIKSK